MPRVNSPAPPFELLSDTIEFRIKRLNMKPEQVGNRIGVCKATMYSRLNNPQQLTLGEIQRIASVLNIPFAELLEAAKSG